MIDLISSSMCRDCFALKTALTHEKIAFREIDIKSLGREEMGELEQSAKNKLVDLRLQGKWSTIEQIMSTPIVRLYYQGEACFMFPVDTINGGNARKEAMDGIRAMLG
jgi:glutaredoxin